MKQSSHKSKFLFLLLLCLALSGCGKMSSPMPIEGSGYPHTYPNT